MLMDAARDEGLLLLCVNIRVSQSLLVSLEFRSEQSISSCTFLADAKCAQRDPFWTLCRFVQPPPASSRACWKRASSSSQVHVHAAVRRSFEEAFLNILLRVIVVSLPRFSARDAARWAIPGLLSLPISWQPPPADIYVAFAVNPPWLRKLLSLHKKGQRFVHVHSLSKRVFVTVRIAGGVQYEQVDLAWLESISLICNMPLVDIVRKVVRSPADEVALSLGALESVRNSAARTLASAPMVTKFATFAMLSLEGCTAALATMNASAKVSLASANQPWANNAVPYVLRAR